MTLLLDTCAFIWLAQEPAKLSPAARAAIDDPTNDLLLSHVSAWEMHLKHHAGKLTLPDPPRQWIPQQMAAWRIQELPLRLAAIHRTADLQDEHRDPFDRLLAAQAFEDALAVVSPDPFFSRCGATVVW